MSSPIEPVISQLRQTLATNTRAVVVAPPGTGKTTRIPPALLDEPWLAGRRILMLEPRRIAARSAAEFMASQRGETVGGTIGYRTRGDSRVGADTRIEVVTERLLTRRLQRDPELADVGLVIFDEVHERSLDTDLGLALALDVADGLRPDLRIVAMSATPDIDRLAALLGDDSTPAPAIVGEGVAHPVTTTYLGLDRRRRLDDEVADAVTRALRETDAGDVLVFLPGRREIRWTAERLAARNVSSVPLTAGLDTAALEAALRPDPTGARKVVLATSVAQTSLTIDGVRVVVDAGLERSARFDPTRGMSGLVTVPVSRSAADQRRGRAGRQAPGWCYRLWTEAEHERKRPQSQPEIDVADLAALVLDVAAWGVGTPDGLRWVTPPPSAGWVTAATTLRALGLLDDTGRSTPDGRLVADLGVHPRLGRLLLDAARAGDATTGALLAAVLESGVRGDLRRALDDPDRDIRRLAAQWERQLRPVTAAGSDGPSGDEDIGGLVAAAFPDRVARRRDASRTRYLTASGTGAAVPDGSPLAGHEWLAVGEAERVEGGDQRVVSGAPLMGAALDGFLARHVEIRAELTDDRRGTLRARSVRAVGAIVVGTHPTAPHRGLVVDAARRLLRDHGLDLVSWSDDAEALRRRVEFARRFAPELPDCTDSGILDRIDEWLPPHIGDGTTVRLGEIRGLDLVRSALTYEQQRTVDRLAPQRIDIPSGRTAVVTYGPDGPTVSVKLQEMFGAPTSPTVADGAVPVTLHLLSPAGRPLQVTQDLASFWAGAYTQVRGEMRGRYPRHPWPEDPTTAVPTARVTHPRRR